MSICIHKPVCLSIYTAVYMYIYIVCQKHMYIDIYNKYVYVYVYTCMLDDRPGQLGAVHQQIPSM